MSTIHQLKREVELLKEAVRVLQRENESLQSQVAIYHNTGVDWNSIGRRARGAQIGKERR